MVSACYCAYSDGVTVGNIVFSAILTAVLSVYFRMPKGWDSAEVLIQNGKNRAHDVAVASSILVFIHVGLSYAIAWSFLAIFA